MACGDLFDVRDFGAQGNGSANDGPAIQSAIDAAAAAGGGVVCLPAGRYRVANAALVPKPRVSIHGAARAPSVVEPSGAIWAFRRSEPSHVHYECEFANFTIRGDGDVSGVNGSGSNLGGVNLEQCDYVTFRNLRVERFSKINGIGIALGGCFWTVLDRCFFQFNQGVDCDLYVQVNGCNQTVIRDCEFVGNNMPASVGLRILDTQNVSSPDAIWRAAVMEMLESTCNTRMVLP